MREHDLSAAASACNLAALAASDAGKPDLARHWCHDQYTRYTRHQALPGPAAIHALEPVINLARLRLRAGDGDTAHRFLLNMHDAAVSRSSTNVDGLTVDFAALTDEEGHQAVVEKLWAVLLADGTRALTSQGHWDQALDQLTVHRGIGRRLLDGRQTAIIAHQLAGRRNTARELLADTTCTEPWEYLLLDSLQARLQTPAALVSEKDPAGLVSLWLAYQPETGLQLFTTQLGLMIYELLTSLGTASAIQRLRDQIIEDGLSGRDAYVAREILGDPAVSGTLSPHEHAEFETTCRRANLGSGTLPEEHQRTLASAVQDALAATTSTLSTTNRNQSTSVG
ncbi:hypothetical protein [Phytomonospora endophytica]|uniref:hypothetical protein n=1 Tax=Phytomonospora endophytica TaxID=714109 RepID=UPI001C847900|nr:hypothetical protein [Phytomonospora endophytica]